MPQPTELWSLQRRPAFRRSAGGGQAIHRVATNIDVAAEAVYAEYHARVPD